MGQHQSITHIYRDSKRRREKGTEILFEEIMADNLFKLGKETDIRTKKLSSKLDEPKDTTPKYIIIKCQKLNTRREKIFKYLLEFTSAAISIWVFFAGGFKLLIQFPYSCSVHNFYFLMIPSWYIVCFREFILSYFLILF